MTSKNSFLARLTENAKRRIWLVVVSLLVFVLAIPTAVALNISVISSDIYYMEEKKVHEYLYTFATDMYSTSNGGIFFLIAVFAIISGIQGFSYLYDRNKIDFYHSKPVKATTRFFSIWLNGILVWIIPYLAGTLLNLLFFAANGILDVKLFTSVWIYVLLACGFYLCIYHLAILALMMTGKVVITLLGILVFLLYEVSVRALFAGFGSYFYHFFYLGEDGKMVIPVLSPVTYLVYCSMEDWSVPFTMLCLLLFAAAVLAIALWCYKKRPSEAAGSSMTFAGTKSFVKIAIAVPVGLVVGLFVCAIVEYGPHGDGGAGFPIFIGTLSLLIICGFMQVIYEGDIKGIFHKKRDMGIAFAIAFAIALIFSFDLTGYDTRVPDADQIEYATVITYDRNRYNYSYLDENMEYLYKGEYAEKHMRLTGESAEAARNLMANSIDLYFSYPSRDDFYEDTESQYVTFAFRLKNGGVIRREIPVVVRDADNLAQIEVMESSEEYIRGNDPGMSEYLYEAVKNGTKPVKATWGNDVAYEEMSKSRAGELLELYREDVLKNSYRAKSTEFPIGQFSISIDRQGTYYYRGDVVLDIYPSYTGCVEYLKANGYETERYIPAEDIKEVIITRYYPGEEEEYYEEYTYSYEGVGYAETKAVYEEDYEEVRVYYDAGQIREIMDAAYPTFMSWDDWYLDDPTEEYWSIGVSFREDSEYFEEHEYGVNYQFKKGQIPSFVKYDFPAVCPTVPVVYPTD